MIGSFSKRFRKFLTQPIGDSFKEVMIFVWKWILLPVLNKIVFLITPHFYRKQILRSVKLALKKEYQIKVKDLEHQIELLEQDRTRLRQDRLKERSSDEVYWEGVKYGHSLKDKDKRKRSPVPNSNMSGMTDAQIFTLKEINKGNSTANGLIAAYLEDRGFVTLVWDDESANKFHYRITKQGERYLEDRKESS